MRSRLRSLGALPQPPRGVAFGDSFLSLVFSLSSATATATIVCCGGDDVVTPTPDASSNVDAGSDSAATADTGGGIVDAGPPPIRCTDADFAAGDFTDGGVSPAAFEITFATGANPKQYENRCVTVKVGASVTWSGAFNQHPLEPAGGDSPNPIPVTDQNPVSGKLVVTFDKAGTFGFQCQFHPTLMFGAIKVVP